MSDPGLLLLLVYKIFESLTECFLGFTFVCVAAVDVTRDVVDGSTLVFFWCYVFRVYTVLPSSTVYYRLVVHMYVVCLINPAKLF